MEILLSDDISGTSYTIAPAADTGAKSKFSRNIELAKVTTESDTFKQGSAGSVRVDYAVDQEPI